MASIANRNRLATPFIPNSPIVFDLPLGGKILQGWVILTGTVVVSAGTTSGTLVGEGAPVNLIKRIKITATRAGTSRYPGGKVVDCTARSLLRYAIYQREGGKYVAEQTGSTLGGGAVGTYPIYLAVPIYFNDSNLRNSQVTALNTDPDPLTPGGTYASVQVQVDAGDLTSCFQGNDRTVVWGGLQVQWMDKRIALAGDTLVRYQEDHLFLIPATMDRARDAAMPRDGAFESWLILSQQSAQLTLSNALLTKVVVEAPSLDQELYAADIYQQMLDEGWIDASQNQTGQLFLDFTTGMLANTVTAAGINAYFQLVNVSGANLDSLLVMTRRVFAPNPPQK